MALHHQQQVLLQHTPPNPSAADGAALYVVAFGASAGGLRAISSILADLPASFPAPIVIVQHLSPRSPSQMAEILSRATPLQVKEAEEGDCLKAGTVYVAPPARHLVVRSGETLSLSDTDKVHYCRPSADVLFLSLAESCGERSVGVILTGGDGDGTAGIRAIKAAGGATFAQDEQSSENSSMPRHAAASGDVDFVLPLPDIAAALTALVMGSTPPVSAGEGAASSASGSSRAETGTQAELDFYIESLRVAEEALRAQENVIADYKRLFSAPAP